MPDQKAATFIPFLAATQPFCALSRRRTAHSVADKFLPSEPRRNGGEGKARLNEVWLVDSKGAARWEVGYLAKV
jgi:hypothetical protein